jgi:D-sedoheptulose 7-phosphate isomerase
MNSSVAEILRAASTNLRLASEGAYPAAVDRAIEILSRAFQSSRTLLIFGNGGSSADAEHLSAELVGRFATDRPPLAAIALSTNPAFLTAWSNDIGFDDVFARQIEALGRPDDVALGISTSGNSPNVVKGLERARAGGLRTLGLSGQGGGRMGLLCDVLMAAPCTETARIQEVHLVTYHAICAALEKKLFGAGR